VGLVSGHRGKPSNRRLSDAIKQAVLSRVEARYSDFGPTLAAEYLREEGLCVGKETLRQWMQEAGLWKVRRKRQRRSHPPRERRARRGELVQIDGSPHDWFEGRAPRCTLIALIDDASSEVVYARFAPVESSQAYLDALRVYVKQHGIPVSLYSDRHGIFTKHTVEDGEPTQFQRALGALGIEGICALTPQAKGRVERLFQTLQDRLVKAMRLAGVSDLAHANAFLAGYIPRHNARFGVAPRECGDAHRAWDGDEVTLARACALHYQRKLSKDLVVSFQRRRYILQTGGRPRYALRGQAVTVVVYPDQRVEMLYGREVLDMKVFDPAQDVAEAVDEKSLNARVDQAVQRHHAPKRPAADHPWRRWTGVPARTTSMPVPAPSG